MDPKTIHNYESVGELPEPERTPSGYRVYDRDDAARLRFVKAARALGLSLGEIKEILGLRDPRPGTVGLCDTYATDLVDRMNRYRPERSSSVADLQKRPAGRERGPRSTSLVVYPPLAYGHPTNTQLAGTAIWGATGTPRRRRALPTENGGGRSITFGKGDARFRVAIRGELRPLKPKSPDDRSAR